jgi:hypothetical protein
VLVSPGQKPAACWPARADCSDQPGTSATHTRQSLKRAARCRRVTTTGAPRNRCAFVEMEGQLRKVIAVVKMRGSQHDKALRLYEITAHGLELGGANGLRWHYHGRRAAGGPRAQWRTRCCVRVSSGLDALRALLEQQRRPTAAPGRLQFRNDLRHGQPSHLSVFLRAREVAFETSRCHHESQHSSCAAKPAASSGRWAPGATSGDARPYHCSAHTVSVSCDDRLTHFDASGRKTVSTLDSPVVFREVAADLFNLINALQGPPTVLRWA